MQEHISHVKNMTQPALVAPNPWLSNPTLRLLLSYILPKAQFEKTDKELSEFGNICNETLYPLGWDAEQNQPRLIKQTVYGEIVDQLITTVGWSKQKEYAGQLGIVGLAYEGTPHCRLIQLLKLQMYQPVSGLYGCPLAMTDGAAYLLQNWLREPTSKDAETHALVKLAFERLTGKEMWTSGQWMTEKDGGSDVSNSTMTIAVLDKDNRYKLYGYKWFSSATDSDVTLTLARIVPQEILTPYDPQIIKKYPLSLFIMRVKDNNKKLNNITIMTLKDKMGTRQLPTAELLLNGSIAYCISDVGKGVKGISQMLNITRVYNASSAIGNLNRLYQIVLDYSVKRSAFGHKLVDLPAHQSFLTKFKLITKGCTIFYFRMAQLLSKIQSGTASKDEGELFRLLTPLLKLYTAKKCVQWSSEGVEALGALGYMENSQIPQMLRDSQVLTIWEGTTNVLSLDFLRALKSTSDDPLQKLDIYCRQNTHHLMQFLSADTKLLDTRKSTINAIAKLANNHNGIVSELSEMLKGQVNVRDAHARIRDLCFMLSENYIGLLYLDLISMNGLIEDILSFEQWVDEMVVYNIVEKKDRFRIVSDDIKLIAKL